MRFVERIGGKREHIVKNRLRCLLRHAAAATAVHHHSPVFIGQTVDKDSAFLLHHILLFFRHGAAHQICPPQRIPGQLAEYLHDLLLIHNAAIGHIQDRRQQRMTHPHRVGMVAVMDILGNGIHRTGTKQRDNGDQILEAIGRQTHQHPFHTLRLELEHTHTVARRQHFIHRRGIQRNIRHRKIRLLLPDHPLGIVNHRQVAQPQKVDLKHTERLQYLHRVLGGNRLAVEAQRHKIANRTRRDHHTGGMRGGVARHPLYPLRHCDQGFHPLVTCHQLA